MICKDCLSMDYCHCEEIECHDCLSKCFDCNKPKFCESCAFNCLQCSNKNCRCCRSQPICGECRFKQIMFEINDDDNFV